ncbi:MCH protein, partial [Rhinopomastus cyanomelas]|nr:MCH protein [Rhinopomastus cyanomelas]
MCVSSSLLILSLSFSQGFLLSVSNSLQKVEDADRLLTTLNLGNALRSEDRAVNGAALPLLKRYEAEDSSILDEENDINVKLLAAGSRNGFLHPAMPFSLGRKQLRYLALQGALAFPGDTAVRDIESMQERETAGRENEAKFPVGRRDFDVLRCMLGRVYRPCWQ